VVGERPTRRSACRPSLGLYRGGSATASAYLRGWAALGLEGLVEEGSEVVAAGWEVGG
jgi:hypothetical protein